ncbi:hypothetical protein SAMN05444266_106522 [Chitinophaga jiangningensis]|uniref:Uncharacterized protein n=1 Tax=Chitinophaga jiangningensis TaxID=1419482 RepID=A0A1M7GEG9_9BACT|nr:MULTISPECIES: hypothetical protein [Chitinophaga]MBV7532807.1 hypothetical protein [Chitinophaga sp. sic0106]SHM14525.1 hypothetical protein SAMN05444266_106522 [Chitinophaga jiangningensis]
MHDIEPYYNWRHLYAAEEDELSPFYGREYSEFEYSNTVYNYYVHPQWDEFGSRNLYMKVLYADYQFGFAIIELLGEWNDTLDNDIMTLKREVIDLMIAEGIRKFILIAENVMNFHSSDDCYYEEWWDDIKDDGGWIVALNMPVQTRQEFEKARLYNYVHLLEDEKWRTYQPVHLFNMIDNVMLKRLE